MSERAQGGADVLVMPGIERRDLTGAPQASAEVLQRAIDQGIMDVIVVGRRRDGSFYADGETADVDRAAGILLRAISWLTTGEFVQGFVTRATDEV